MDSMIRQWLNLSELDEVSCIIYISGGVKELTGIPNSLKFSDFILICQDDVEEIYMKVDEIALDTIG